MSEQLKRYATIKNLRFVISLVMFVWLGWYFYTGFGGPSELVAALVPVALMVQILCTHENGYIYKRLPPSTATGTRRLVGRFAPRPSLPGVESQQARSIFCALCSERGMLSNSNWAAP